MAADPQMWKAFIEHLEKMITEKVEELAPLESGEMKLGHRGADTGFEWIDITEPQAKRIKGEITGLQNVINRVKKEHPEIFPAEA